MDEFQRITLDTEFNGTKLLDGTFDLKELQIGANKGQNLDLEISSIQASSIFEKTIGTGRRPLEAMQHAAGRSRSLSYVESGRDGV